MDEDEKTVFELRLEQLRRMPPGPDRDEAIANLTRDYQGRSDVLSGQLTGAENQLADAFSGMPQAQVAGPSSNPFAIAVAPDITQYLAQGLRGYDAMNRRKQAMEGLEGLSQGREAGLGAMFQAGVGDRQAALADSLRGNAMQNAGFGTLGLSEEELRRLYGR